MISTRTWRHAAAALLLSSALTGCHGLFDVEAPGKIADADLNSKLAIPGLVTGMSYDLAAASNGIEEASALASGELFHGGSYNWGEIPRGVVHPEDINGSWSSAMRARYTTNAGIERIKGLLSSDEFAKSPFVARAYLMAGFAHRIVGENFCQTISPDASATLEPNTAEFDRGIAAFSKAVEIGTAAGSANANGVKATDIVSAAYAGRASLRAWKGDWAAAAADAQKVPTAFVYVAPLMTDGLTNTLFYETHSRYEYTVFSTEFAAHYGDVRAPWDTIKLANGRVAVGANGQTPMFQQRKYNTGLGDDIPLTKGTEMLVLRAEAALRSNDIGGAYALMNEARAFYKMAPLPVATTAAKAWDDLHYERSATVWLENRHFWDARRWFAESGPAHFDFLNGRDKAFPIADNERRANKNAQSAPDRCQ